MSEVTQALDSAGDDLEDGGGPPERPSVVVASDPRAAEVARQVLREGGGALDAAAAAAAVVGGDWSALVWEPTRSEPVGFRAGGATEPPLEGSYRGHPVWLLPDGAAAPAALEALRQLDEVSMRDMDDAERDDEIREAVRLVSPGAVETAAAGGVQATEASCVVVVDGRGTACSLVSPTAGATGSAGEAVPSPMMVSRADRPWLLLAFAGSPRELQAQVHIVAQVVVHAIDLARPLADLATGLDGLHAITIDPDTGIPAC